MPIISIKYKLIIILNPKCASTSIINKYRVIHDFPYYISP